MTKNNLTQKILLSLTLLCQIAWGQNWYEQDIWKNEDRAFLWYPDTKKPKKEEQTNQPHVQNELIQFEMLQKQLDESRKIAIMNPSEENLKRYIQLQEIAMNQASSFTDQWQRVIWANPDLDYSQNNRPNNSTAQYVYDAQRQQQKTEAIRQLAAENGILFVFRSDCPYCHAMAPIVQQFSQAYGIKVMPVSLDGGKLSEFPYSLPNNGIAQRLNINTVPALYIMDTKTKQFKPIGFGVMAQTTLEDRFLALSKPVGSLY